MGRTTRKSSPTLRTRYYSIFLKFGVFRIFLLGPSIFGPRVFGFPRYRSHSFEPTMITQLRMEGINGRRPFGNPASLKNAEVSVPMVNNIVYGLPSSTALSGRKIFHTNEDCRHSRFNSNQGGRRTFPYYSNIGLSLRPQKRQNFGQESMKNLSALLSPELSFVEIKQQIQEHTDPNNKILGVYQDNNEHQASRSLTKLPDWLDYDSSEDSKEDDDDDDESYEDWMDWFEDETFKC